MDYCLVLVLKAWCLTFEELRCGVRQITHLTPGRHPIRSVVSVTAQSWSGRQYPLPLAKKQGRSFHLGYRDSLTP